MKIIIDIPEEIYRASQILDVKYEDTVQIPLEVIAKGTPLPKGHGRLIDADDAISKICGISCGCNLMECGYDRPCFSIKRIQSAHTIIEADKEREEEE